MIRKIHPVLPVHRIDAVSTTLLYIPPGKVTEVTPLEAHGLELLWTGSLPAARFSAALDRKKTWCEETARKATDAWHSLGAEPFSPTSLIIYLNNNCNCGCSYCFSKEMSRRTSDGQGCVPVIPLGAVAAGARVVAEVCKSRAAPFVLVVHGGGEPTINWDLLTSVYSTASEIAGKNGIRLQAHVCSNGIVNEERARWLAGNFTRCCISCDGPPHINDRHRVLLNGDPTSRGIERTAAAIKAAGGLLEVRATITPDSVRFQEEIAEYLCITLKADALRFEPIYSTGGRVPAFSNRDAPLFVDHFLKAQRIALRHDRPLYFSGVRLDEMHGPFCDTAKNALHLLPDGTVSSCFFAVEGGADAKGRNTVGRYDRRTDTVVFDFGKLDAARRRAFSIPARCADCLNRYHCSRGCPESCAALAFPVAVDSAGAINDFRCRVNRLLTGRWLSRCVALGDTGGDREAPGPQRYPVESRSLPEPYWSRYGFSENGDDAWKAVGERIRELSPLQAISLYVHIPFCKRRCAFCDCLSRPLRDGARESFCNALLSEITLWGALSPLRCCPVTTVHFGGGTPVSLSLRHLERIVSALRHSFGISKATEIALESTSSDLTVSNLRQLRSIGFSRIHVGVQSFDDGLRMRIGRASSSRQVSHAIEASLDAGMITSVDLVYGLPGQSRQSFIESARRACEEAVHGVSLYRFNQSGRNKEFVRRHPEFSANANADFRSFLDADDLLAGRGYKKNHFVHYAMPEDLNLYYTSPLRGEPLIAIGPTADGVIADYLYRHLDADAYVAQGAPAFCGGKEIPLHLRDVGKVGARLMCSRAERTGFAALGIEDLFDRWVKDELLTDTGLRDVYSLTGKGSWFIANMLDELELVAPNRP